MNPWAEIETSERERAEDEMIASPLEYQLLAGELCTAYLRFLGSRDSLSALRDLERLCQKVQVVTSRSIRAAIDSDF